MMPNTTDQTQQPNGKISAAEIAAADPRNVPAPLDPHTADLAPERPAVNWERVRADFPILRRTLHDKPLVFLDSAATSQKPQAVLDAMDEYYLTTNANIHRGAYTLSEEATRQYEGARARIARFIGAKSSKEIIYTRNATEALNLVAYSWGRANLRRGDVVVLTKMEHHSNLVPWQILAAELGIVIRYIDVSDRGTLVLDNVPRLLEGARMVSLTHMSNVLGTINPLAEIAAEAHAAGALVMADGAQSVPHIPVDVNALGVDFYAFSGHKMCGPTGIGVLWGKRDLLKAMPPFLGGGDMISEVTLEGFKPNELPWKFEAGTPAIAEAIGLGAAVDYLSSIGMDAVHEREHELIAYALDRITPMPGVRVYGPSAEEKGGVLAFSIEGAHPHDVATIMDSEGICLRAGHHCAQPLMIHYDVPALARASFYIYTTFEEIDALVEGIRKVQKVFA